MSRIEASNYYRFEILGQGNLQELVIFYYLVGDDEECKYGIPINGIGNVLDDSHVSEWIAQLYNKLWVSDNMLYDLAKQIKILSPKNKIDWIKTFFMVEKYNYLKQDVEQENEIDTSISAFAIVRSEIERSRELASDTEFKQRLTDQITDRLKREKLI